MRDGLNDFATTNHEQPGAHYTGVAVRFGVPQVPVWTGVPGVDWGTSLLNVNAADGAST